VVYRQGFIRRDGKLKPAHQGKKGPKDKTNGEKNTYLKSRLSMPENGGIGGQKNTDSGFSALCEQFPRFSHGIPVVFTR